jgi:hypothetical protein
MPVGVHTKRPAIYCCQTVTKTEICRQILVELPVLNLTKIRLEFLVFLRADKWTGNGSVISVFLMCRVANLSKMVYVTTFYDAVNNSIWTGYCIQIQISS